MSTRFYNTDLTDAAWTWVAPVLPAALPGGDRQEATTRVQDHGLDLGIAVRSFAWWEGTADSSKDYEYRLQTSEAMIDLAAIRLMLEPDRPCMRLFKHPLILSCIIPTAQRAPPLGVVMLSTLTMRPD